jgi:hypothetical protein
MTNSCFSHAIAIAEGKFLSNLTPSSKKKPALNNQVDSSPSEDIRAGEVDPDVDDEDTEEEIEELVKEVEEVLADLPQNSEPSKLAAKLLLKVRGFIAKVGCLFRGSHIHSPILIFRRFADRHKQRNTSRSAAKQRVLSCLSFSPIARLVGVHGMVARLLVLKKVYSNYHSG